MSLHFYLNLSYDVSQEELEASYKKYLVQNHPDRSKKNTLQLYLDIQREYEKYKKNLTDENFFICCFPSEVKEIVCRCGSRFYECNLIGNKIECECCSCYIIVEKEPHALTSS